MTHENSPLLPKNRSTQSVEYGLPTKTEFSNYDRFAPGQKRMILALVSLAGMIPCKSLSLFPETYIAFADWLIFVGDSEQCLLLVHSCHVYHKYLATYERRGPSSSKSSSASAPRVYEQGLTSRCIVWRSAAIWSRVPSATLHGQLMPAFVSFIFLLNLFKPVRHVLLPQGVGMTADPVECVV